jgi:LacI family transcriptional regulator
MLNKDRRSPTMKDVARLAGVSQTTVSFVLNNLAEAGIPDETQQRVWEAIEQLGYRPNAMAQGLRRQRTNTIGFITDEIATTPYAGQIIEGAQDAAWDNDRILLVVNTKGNLAIENRAIEMLLDRKVDGIIYATMYHQPVNPPLVLREVPTVLLDCFAEDRSYPSVVPEEVGGGRKATEYLLQKGHRRIGFINHPHIIPATAGRLQGYQEALAAFGIPFDETLVCTDKAESEGGYDGTMSLMQLPEPPTAIFCFNDRTAMGAYDALRKLGLAIPENVAVVGFDNQEIIAAHLYPPLTTMQLPHYAMGEWAVRHLTGLLDGADHPEPVQHQIECPLVVRASV